MKHYFYYFLIFVIINLLLISCHKNEYFILKGNSSKLKLRVQQTVKHSQYTKSDSLIFIIKGVKHHNQDSISVFLNKKLLNSEKLEDDLKLIIPLNDAVLGENLIDALIKSKDITNTFEHKIFVLPQQEPKELFYTITDEYNHNPKDFTQGFIVNDGIVTESTGGYGTSVLKTYNYKTGEIIFEHQLPKKYFGEGLTQFKEKLFQLTYKENKILVYHAEDLKFLKEKDFFSEGWGITHNNEKLIVSNGSSKLFFLDPETLEVTDTLVVFDNKGEVNQINELEYINGEIFANIWRKDEIIIIDSNNGEVLKKINLKELVRNYHKVILSENVLNGIAYDSTKNEILITGKRWSVIFKIEILSENDHKQTNP